MAGAIETDGGKVARRLVREGWTVRHGGNHDVYANPAGTAQIVMPRHRTLSIGVARKIARQAGWI